MKGENQLLTFFIVCLSIHKVWSQPSQVGIVDFYGKLSIKADVRKCVPFKENDTIRFLITRDTAEYAKVKGKVVACLLANPEVKQADMEFVCCEWSQRQLDGIYWNFR